MSNAWTRLGVVVGAMAIIATATACEDVIDQRIDETRATATLPPLDRDPVLDAAADAKAAEMCTTGTPTPTPDPATRYDAETAAAIDELVAAAPLDPDTTDPGTRNGDATNQIWAQWADDPTIGGTWDDLGIGETECPDGNLYMATILQREPTMPPTGRYSTAIYGPATITQVPDLEYRTAVDHLGNTVSLQLDLFLPPTTGGPALRPTLVLVHGGGFHSGSRVNFFGTAKEYARRGFVTAAISYRLRPNDTPEEQLAAATDAVDDGMESIRWLKANAATYGIDTTRIAVIGLSAGAAIGLSIGNLTDPTPTGPLSAYSTSVAAVVASGASLSSVASIVDWDADDAAALMYHYETDTSTGDTDEFAFETCAAMRDAGNTCDFVLQAGAGHTTPVGPLSTNWTERMGPFLWAQLRLS